MRRGLVLIAVLLVTVAMAAGLTAMLSGVRGQSEAVFAVVTRQEQRLAARSAAYAIAQELGEARDRILAGEEPGLAASESVIRVEGRDGWGWAIRQDEGSVQLDYLSGRVDVNAASDEVLSALLGNEAEGIAEAKPIRTPGALRALFAQQDEVLAGEDDGGVIERLTLFSIDPQVRSGAGGPAGSRGTARVGVESGTSAPVGLSAEGAAFYAGIADGAWRPSSLGHMLRELQVRAIPEEDWDLLLDAVYVGSDEPRRGLIDLNHASEEVLAALPGMDETIAMAIVDRRESLSGEDRAGLSWPVREGVVDLDIYAGVIDLLTVRSLQLGVRFRVEREPEELGVNDEFNAPRLEGEFPALEYYGIVDLAGSSPRFVYLREVTYEPWAGDVAPVRETDDAEVDVGLIDEVVAEPLDDGEVPNESGEEQLPDAQEAPGMWGRFVAGRGA